MHHGDVQYCRRDITATAKPKTAYRAPVVNTQTFVLHSTGPALADGRHGLAVRQTNLALGTTPAIAVKQK